MSGFLARCTSFFLFATALAALVSSLPAGPEHGRLADRHHEWHDVVSAWLNAGLQPNSDPHDVRYTHNLLGVAHHTSWLDQQHAAATHFPPHVPSTHFPPHVPSDGPLSHVSPQRADYGRGTTSQYPPSFSLQGNAPLNNQELGFLAKPMRTPSRVSPQQGNAPSNSHSASFLPNQQPTDWPFLDDRQLSPVHPHYDNSLMKNAQSLAAAELATEKAMEPIHRGLVQTQHPDQQRVWLPRIGSSSSHSSTSRSSEGHGQSNNFKDLGRGVSMSLSGSHNYPSPKGRVAQFWADLPEGGSRETPMPSKRRRIDSPSSSRTRNPPDDPQQFWKKGMLTPGSLPRNMETGPPKKRTRARRAKYFYYPSQRIFDDINSKVFGGKLKWVQQADLDERLRRHNRLKAFERSRLLPLSKLSETSIGPHPFGTIKEFRLTSHYGPRGEHRLPQGHVLLGKTYYNIWGIPDRSEEEKQRMIFHFGTGYANAEDELEVQVYLKDLGSAYSGAAARAHV